MVKFRAAARLPAATLYQQGRSFAPYTGSPYLGGLHQRYQVKEIRPLAETLVGGGRTALDASAWAAHVEAVRRRFPARARRAPGAARLPDLSTVYLLSVPEGTDLERLAREYAADPSVEYAEPDRVYRLSFVPNDPFFSSSGSWGQPFPDLWGLHNIQAEQAWDLSTGAGIVVAVIDTGLSTELLEINANLWTNPGEIASNGIDDDGNGFADDVHGWDFTQHRGEVSDIFGHGTHVSGTIAAVGNNGAGILGVAWQAHVMPLTVFDGLAQANSSSIAAALMYAVENGADVVNMSFGGVGDSLVLTDAIDYASANGLVLVAAAGNGAIDVKTFSPADLDPVIAVGAVDHTDGPAFFSNFGGKIELAAPGGGDAGPPRFEPYASVLSLARSILFDPRLYLTADGGDQTFSLLRLAGTSMAAPHVSGTAALILSRHPEFTVEQVRQALRDGADDLGPPGRDARYGYGRLNAGRSVSLDDVVVARLTAPRHLSRFHGEPVRVEGTVHDPGGGPASWQLSFGAQGQALSVIASGTGEIDHAALATVDTAPLARGNYVLRLEATAPGGARGTDSLILTRLAGKPYLRQLSDQGGIPTLDRDAWSADGRTLVWSDITALGSYEVVAADLPTGTEAALSRFQFGIDNGLTNSFAETEAVISADGHTVAFSGPEDLSTSNTSTANRNVQLFAIDTSSHAIEQLSHVAGGERGAFQGLTIAPDGSRIAFTSVLDLDPAPGNPGFFYWDRGDASFHQITSAPTPLAVHSPVLGADGRTIAFLCDGDLDPAVGNPTHAFQVFLYDVPSGGIRQLTRMDGSLPVRQLGLTIAMSPDSAKIAASVDTSAVGAPSPDQHSLVLIDVASATVTELVSMPSGGSTAAGIQFSPDGARLYFQSPTSPDPRFPPFNPSTQVAAGLFRYDLTSGLLERLTGFPSFFSVGPDERIALDAAPIGVGIDPEGSDADTTREIFLLDPDSGGGFAWLRSGQIASSRSKDRFKMKGSFVQPAGLPVDPSSSTVAVTLLGANGQLFRAELPPAAVATGARTWTYHGVAGTGLTRLVIRKIDGTHYSFDASGTAAGLFAATTSYLAFELQIGEAVFGNAASFRAAARQFRYP